MPGQLEPTRLLPERRRDTEIVEAERTQTGDDAAQIRHRLARDADQGLHLFGDAAVVRS